MTAQARTAQTLPVYPASDLRVTNGANLGDPVGFAAELVHDDIYTLDPGARRLALSLTGSADESFTVAPGSKLGVPGAEVHLDSCLTLMTAEGRTTEALILVELDAEGHVVETYLLPLAPLEAETEYTLVGVDTEAARQKFAQVACVSFARGTRITLASGAMVPIEQLTVGDRVLTRDDGPQQIRWIGETTVRAVGDFSPICIAAGTLNNAGDLLVSPEHRLFVYQRDDTLGVGRAEVMVRARHLVNGTTVVRAEGGFVDYFQLLFDDHQIIYAEGIAAESLLVDSRTRPALPKDLGREVLERMGASARTHADYEVQEALLRRPDAAEMLRRASSR